VSLGGPNIYPGVLSWLGVARELTAGTPVAPVITHPLDQGSFEPEDSPKFLKDMAVRGAMTNLFYETLGVESATFSFGGPNFLDSHGYFFDNVFGDLSTTGSNLANPSTTSGVLPVGATNMTLASAPPSQYSTGAVIQIGVSPTAEVVVISTTAGSNVINFVNNPLRFTHPTAQTVQTAGTPFTHKWAALNSPLGYGGAYGAQPPTHTLTDVTNIVTTFTSATYSAPTNTYGARQYPFAALKNIDLSGNAEQLLGVKMSGDSFISQVAGTSPTNITTNSRPIPNWNTTVVVAGQTVASSGSYAGIGEFMISMKRATQVYWIVAGTQNPYVIARGPLNSDGTIQWDPTNSETPLDLMLGNYQGAMSISVTNSGIPNSGTPFTLTFTSSQVANVKSKIMRSKQLIGYGNSWESIANSTDVGGSGGLGPCTLTLINNTSTYDATNWMVNEGVTPRQMHLL
jgi:hypothetical protein